MVEAWVLPEDIKDALLTDCISAKGTFAGSTNGIKFTANRLIAKEQISIVIIRFILLSSYH
jgi:hypothetical protein